MSAPTGPVSQRAGYSIHIAVSQVGFTKDWDPVPAMLDNLQLMHALAMEEGYQAQILATGSANSPTLNKVTEALAKTAELLQPTDQLLLTFAGHGNSLGDKQSWVLEDDYLVDETLFKILQTMKAGVRVLIVSDSCHSGGMALGPDQDGGALRCSTILMAASKPLQSAWADAEYGVFTHALGKVRSGGFSGNHRDFFSAVKEEVKDQYAGLQTPTYVPLGRDLEALREFENARPFDLTLPISAPTMK